MTKEKLSLKQFLLILNGPSCGGKSSVSDVFLGKYGGIFNAKSDQIKWLISDYDANVHQNIIHEMIVELIQVALKNGLSVLKEGALWEPEKILQITKDMNVTFFVANISAPREILEKRFLERVEAKKKGAKISNVDPERFWDLNDKYLATKMESPLEFDSSLQTAEEIADTISKYIQKNLN